MKTNKVVLAAIGGLAAGAALGILFAPRSGKKTRKKIAEKSKALKEHAKEDFDKLIEKIDHKYKTISDDAHRLLQESKSKAENGMTNKI